MRGIGRLLLPLLALGPAAGAGIAVRESQGKIDVAAAAAPLADVLDRLAHQTGMKVVYEGPAPRQLVTLSLVGRSPAEAVTAILEGQGLNYALVLDATATRVEKLLVTGAATPAGFGHSPGRSVAPALERSRVLRPDNDPEPEEVPEETTARTRAAGSRGTQPRGARHRGPAKGGAVRESSGLPESAGHGHSGAHPAGNGRPAAPACRPSPLRPSTRAWCRCRHRRLLQPSPHPSHRGKAPPRHRGKVGGYTLRPKAHRRIVLR